MRTPTIKQLYSNPSIKYCLHILPVVAVGVIAWPIVQRVPSQVLMHYIYPYLVAAHLLAALVLAGRYVMDNRSPLVFQMIILVLVTMLGYLMLALVTGSNPAFDIDQWRWMVTWVRLLAVASITSVNVVGIFLVVQMTLAANKKGKE